MATNVFTHAKTLRKKPGNRHKSWAQLVKQSAADLRGKKKSVGRKPSKAKRKAAPRKKKAARKRKVSGTVTRKISGTVAQHISAAQAQLKEQIGWAEAMRFTAKTKKSKREIAKRIAQLKARYRKLC